VFTFFIEQFGCRATQADGAALENQLLQRGYTPATRNVADVVIVNTCTVTSAADAQARDVIRKITANNRAARVIVTGCYAQRAPEELAALPGVAWVVGNSHKPELPQIVQNLPLPSLSTDFVSTASLLSQPRRLEEQARILTGPFENTPLLSAPIFGREGNHTRPTLKIQDGCNSRCSFCVIPFVRGKSRSLSPESVISEINSLVNSGVREVVLSGINLGTYGKDLTPRFSFDNLLRRILDETPLERLRISSIEPMDVTSDLIDFFAANHRIAQHLHMPLQSGTDRILAAMHRWYRSEHYARRVRLIRERLPNAAVGADVIAGFPGETDEEHSSTVRFIESLPFTYLHVFSFSKRPSTAAAKLTNEVPANVVKNRARELRAISDGKSAAFRREQIGRLHRVLTLRSGIEEVGPTKTPVSVVNPLVLDKSRGDRESGYTPALSSNYLRVRLLESSEANQWLDVRIIAEKENYLVAVAAMPNGIKTAARACVGQPIAQKYLRLENYLCQSLVRSVCDADRDILYP
jgi:threonylcarbamoyladenosine tRNA methylthiotransferase MtaB